MSLMSMLFSSNISRGNFVLY